MDRGKFEKLMGLIFEVNADTKSHISYHHSGLSNTLKLEFYEDDECLTTEKVTLSLNYMLIENDYLYVITKCKVILARDKKVG